MKAATLGLLAIAVALAGCAQKSAIDSREECREFYFNNATYQKYLREAYEYVDTKNFIGLTRWEALGYDSAKEYALKSMRSLYLVCVNRGGLSE